MAVPPGDSPRILVIRRDNIGDLACTTPLIDGLRARWPDAHLAALVTTYNAEVLARITPHWRRCIERARHLHELGLFDPELDEYRWMIEEYRVAQYAQQLGTARKVSEKLLEEQWGRTRSL